MDTRMSNWHENSMKHNEPQWGSSNVVTWKKILNEAESQGDTKRAEYARYILKDVLKVKVEAKPETPKLF